MIVTPKHYIKSAPVEAIATLRRLSGGVLEGWNRRNCSQMLPRMIPKLTQRMNRKREANGSSKHKSDLNV